MLSGIKTISPDEIGSIEGFIGDRFRVNLENRIRDWRMAEHFVELYEQGNHDSWFWMGEQIGKWLDAAAYSAVIAAVSSGNGIAMFE